MGTNCRGREDCRQEELVILRCKYFQPAGKKEHVSRVDRSLRALGVLPGPRLHFECKLNA